MPPAVEPYLAQTARWPARGRHVLAHYDDDGVVVYQAYRPSIGRFAAEHGYFGGEWSLGRMSWVKPGFLWMMFRSGWAMKEGQEVVLAVTIARAAFDEILRAAVTKGPSDVRLQWDPDHGPSGHPVERRAIQLGLRGAVLAKYAREWIRRIEDITPFVHEQHAAYRAGGKEALVTPIERIYPVPVGNSLGVDPEIPRSSVTQEANKMRFMVMHKVDAQMESGGPPPARIVEHMGKFIRQALESKVFVDGAGLHRSATRLRVSLEGGKRTVTKGPFEGGNQLVTGFAMIQTDSIDHAVEVASRMAKALGDPEIEIGPLVEPWDLGLAEKPEGLTPRFLLLRKADRAFETGTPRQSGLKSLLAELTKEGVLLSAATLAPTRNAARYRKVAGKREWTDGPFTESKELIAGYSIIEVPAMADAKKWAEAYADILGDNEVDVRVVD
jgi:hypothetical protein